jgi:hypothetical protein
VEPPIFWIAFMIGVCPSFLPASRSLRVLIDQNLDRRQDLRFIALELEEQEWRRALQ